MARNLLNALGSYHDVNVASEFVSRDGKGEHRIQRKIAERGAKSPVNSSFVGRMRHAQNDRTLGLPTMFITKRRIGSVQL